MGSDLGATVVAICFPGHEVDAICQRCNWHDTFQVQERSPSDFGPEICWLLCCSRFHSSCRFFEFVLRLLCCYCYSQLCALFSAVDPVAVIALFGGTRFRADPVLVSLLDGECVLYDAAAIVIFHLLGKTH